MRQVHLVVSEVSEDGVRILAACSEISFADDMAKDYRRKHWVASVYVVSMDILEPPPKVDYRVWVRFGDKGIEYTPELRLSIPMQKDCFEPLEPGAKYHGSITVEATSEEEATAKAKQVFANYINALPILLRRKEGYVGVAGSVS